MMTIKDGKFYKDGVHVPIEHGNKEQIEILKRIEEMREGFDPEITIYKKIVMEFTCICGIMNEFQFRFEDTLNDIIGNQDKCHYCKMKYGVINSDEDWLMLKMIPKKT